MGGHDCDAVIVGAGPAGSMTAYRLATAGLHVLLLDAAWFPRWKTCGGGITARAARLLPTEARDSFETELTGLRFSLRLGNAVTRHAEAPLIYGVRRCRFDARLVELAIEAGAIFRDGSALNGFEVDQTGVRVAAEQDVVRASVLVGADGANSRISRHLNSPRAFSHGGGLATEIPLDRIDPRLLDDRIALLDAGSLTRGYGWAFPKGPSVNVGVGGLDASIRHLRPYFNRLISPGGLVLIKPGGPLAPAGYRLPTLTSETRLTGERLLLVGDAAGLIEPFTGDGISYALASAKMAADAIVQAFETGAWEFPGYAHRVRTDLADDFGHARSLASWFYAWPGLLHRMIPTQDHLWRGLCEVIDGTRTYASFRRLLLGRLEGLWPIIDTLSALTTKRRHKQGFIV